jgi:hypothetical protein
VQVCSGGLVVAKKKRNSRGQTRKRIERKETETTKNKNGMNVVPGYKKEKKNRKKKRN